MTTTVTLTESRYDRQERITWWDQDRLAAAKVLVIGAGALGNEVVKNLTLVGAGDIVVADVDVVDHSNLARCVFFRDGDDGRPKAEVVAERASELNADCRVTGIHLDLRAVGTGLVRRADVVVGALDNREARLLLNRLAWRNGKPWVDGAIEGLTGVARVFGPPSSCYECTLSETDWEFLAHRQSCRLLSHDDLVAGKVPTTASTAAIVAGLQAQEVVKLLHGHRPEVTSMPGGLFVDGFANDAYPLTYPFDEDCFAHHVFTDPIRVTADAAMTPADVARVAGFGDAVVELGADHIVGWRCASCDVHVQAGVAVPLASFTDAACPQCGEARQPDTASSIEVPSPLADRPLVDLGVRPDEILAVRRGVTYRYVWLDQPAPFLPEGW